MDTQAFEYLKEGEGGWWYRGRESFVTQMLQNQNLSRDGRVLDFGSGYGAMHPFLSEYGTVDAYEIDASAAEGCRTRGYRHVFTEPNQLAVVPSYRTVGAFDVLEHLADDRLAIRRIYDLLLPGGTFVATVPAFKFLWSAHDELHHHFRRYTITEIQQRLQKAGFTNIRATYWNMTLLPAAYLARMVGAGGGKALTPAPFVGRVFSAILRLESVVVPHMPLPFGTGIVIIGMKPGSGAQPPAPSSAPLSWSLVLNPVFIFATLYHHRFTRFLFVGGTGAFLNLALTWFFTTFVFGIGGYLDAFLIGIAGNIIYNFFLNTIVTFKTTKRHGRRFVGFVLYSLAASALLYHTVKLVTPIFGIEWYLAVITAVILAYAVVNFSFFKYILFRETV